MVKIVLDKERHLKLTIRGMLLYEEKTGHSLFKGFNLSEMPFKNVVTLLWVCLIHEDESLTLDQFIDLCPMNRLMEISEKCMECISESLAEQDDSSPLANPPNG